MNKRITFYGYFFASYLVILIIPFLIGSVLYVSAADIVKRQCIDLQHAVQENAVQVMDTNIHKCNEFVLQLFFDNDITSLGQVNTENMGSDDIVLMLNALNKRNFYKLTGVFIEDYYILFPGNGIVFSSNILVSDMEFFYHNYLTYASLDYNEWYGALSGCTAKTVWPASSINKNGMTANMVTYLQPLDTSRFISDGVVMFLFDEKHIEEKLGVNENPHMQVCILDEKNRLIYTNNKGITDDMATVLGGKINSGSGFFEHSFNDGNMLTVYTASNLNGWKYVSLIPTRIALNEVSIIRSITAMISVAVLFAGVIAAGVIAHKTSFPIWKIFLLLIESNSLIEYPKSSLELLENGVGRLISENQEIRNGFEEQNKILNELCLEHILNGNFPPGNEGIQKFIMNHNRLEQSGIFYCVLLIKSDHPAEPDTDGLFIRLKELNTLINSILSRVRPHIKADYTHLIKKDELAVILGGDDEKALRTHVNMLVEQIRLFIDADKNTSCYIGIGAYCSGRRSIRDSYKMARFAIDSSLASDEDGYVFYSEDLRTADAFLYSPDLELRLIGKVKSGNVKDTCNILDDIYTANFKDNKLMPYMMKCLLFNLYCTFLKISNSPPSEIGGLGSEFISALEHNHGEYCKLFDEIKNTLIQLAIAYDKNKKSHNTVQIENILAYIAKNYSDCNLDTVTIATAFNITEGYFCQFFKEQTGTCFTAYITQYRLDKACTLLKDGGRKIEDVSSLVGYSNVYSFRRAFKRVLGFTPSEYRDDTQIRSASAKVYHDLKNVSS